MHSMANVQIKEQILRVSFPCSMLVVGLNTGCDPWQQMPLSAEPSHWPLIEYFLYASGYFLLSFEKCVFRSFALSLIRLLWFTAVVKFLIC